MMRASLSLASFGLAAPLTRSSGAPLPASHLPRSISARSLTTRRAFIAILVHRAHAHALKSQKTLRPNVRVCSTLLFVAVAIMLPLLSRLHRANDETGQRTAHDHSVGHSEIVERNEAAIWATDKTAARLGPQARGPVRQMNGSCNSQFVKLEPPATIASATTSRPSDVMGSI